MKGPLIMYLPEDHQIVDDPRRGRQMVSTIYSDYGGKVIFTMPHGTPDGEMWERLRLMHQAYTLGVKTGRREKAKEIQEALNPNK